MDTAIPKDYIQYAVPFFLGLIALEVWASWKHRKNFYSFSDSINDLSMGLVQRVTDVFLIVPLFVLYTWIFEKTGTLKSFFSQNPVIHWVAGMILVDLAYYWFHRFSHEVSVIWGSHSGHHQSEEYNLTVALRQGGVQSLFSFPFFAVLAVIGIEPQVFSICWQINLIYQFGIHTRFVKTLGPLEWVLNTPSHHRVHHGKNPIYIDKNYGGILVIWDRLFGTFTPETVEPVYGVVKPLNSWNPIWANSEVWAGLLFPTARFSSVVDRIRLWWKPPGWTPESPHPEIPEVDARTYQKFLPPMSRQRLVYVLVQFAVVVVCTLILSDPHSAAWSTGARVVSAGWILFSLASIGWVMELRRFARWTEIVRSGALPVLWLIFR